MVMPVIEVLGAMTSMRSMGKMSWRTTAETPADRPQKTPMRDADADANDDSASVPQVAAKVLLPPCSS